MLTTDGLAALVDSVGGVQAAVDVDVVTTDAKGNETVVVRAGNQHLKGPAAAAYATYLADGEPEQARLARFDDVLTAVAAALPKDHASLVAALAALGDGSRSTLDSSALADRLAVLGSAAGRRVAGVRRASRHRDRHRRRGDVVRARCRPGGRHDARPLPGCAAAGRERREPAGPGGERRRDPGLVEKARTKLVDAGFRFINGGNASPFNADPAACWCRTAPTRASQRGRRVAAALGLPDVLGACPRTAARASRT